MSRPLFAAILGPSLLISSVPVQAQTQPNTSQSTASRSAQACNELMDELRDTPIAERPVSLRQVREDRRAGNVDACRMHLQTIRSSTDGQSDDAARTTQERGGQITIRQQSPRVTVQPGRPEVFIQQQRPIVTVELPPPRVTVRMPQPDLNLVGSQGKERQLNMDKSLEPQVRYESAQPRVVVRQTQAQPEVKFERSDAADVQARGDDADQGRADVQKQSTAPQQKQARNETDQSTENRQPESTARAGPQSEAGTQMRVSELLEMSLYDARGLLLGDVERVVQSDGRTNLIIGRGGFLGMGEKQIAIPADTVSRNGDRLISHERTAAQAERAREWSNLNNATDMSDQQMVRLRGA